MNVNDFYLLTNQELVVCAGLLGAGILYGVQDVFFGTWEESSAENVDKTVRGLEESGKLTFFLDGTVQMDELLLKCMTCMVHCEQLLCLDHSTFYYKKGNVICCMEVRKGAKNKVYLCKSIPDFVKPSHPIQECLKNRTIRQVRELEDSFEQEEALRYLKSNLRCSGHGELVQKTLRQIRRLRRICYWKWEANLLREKIDVRYQIEAGRQFIVTEEKNGDICFDGKSNICNHIFQEFFGGECQ